MSTSQWPSACSANCSRSYVGRPFSAPASCAVGDGCGEPVVALLASGEHQQVAALGVGDSVLRHGEVERELGSEDGLDLGVALGGLGEAHHAVEAVVVGDADADEPQPLGLLEQLLGRARAVEEAEGGVHVQLGVRHDRLGAGGLERARPVRLALVRPRRAVAAVARGGRPGPPAGGEGALELRPRDRGIVEAHQSAAHQSYRASACQRPPSSITSQASPAVVDELHPVHAAAGRGIPPALDDGPGPGPRLDRDADRRGVPSPRTRAGRR